jgi:YVTN family beta-propeller protein
VQGHVNVNPSNDTIYATNANGNTVSVIDGATCNARHTGGHGQTQTVDVGNGPYPIAVDQHTDAVYITSISTET